MITGFVIWSLISLIFWGIGFSSWKAKEPVGFFTGVKPAKMKDITAYNRAVAKIWFVFAGLLEILGIPLLFLEQNSPLFFVVQSVQTTNNLGKEMNYCVKRNK